MWIFVGNGTNAYNMAHVTRLFVEETGSGAALKAEIAGKTLMVGYFESRAVAQAALADVMQKLETNAAVVRF